MKNTNTNNFTTPFYYNNDIDYTCPIDNINTMCLKLNVLHITFNPNPNNCLPNITYYFATQQHLDTFIDFYESDKDANEL